jgi:hypothetical protein
MSTTTKNKTSKGVRYTDAQKKEVIDFALSYNAANGRGGQSKAAEKFKISQITIASWLKAAGAPAKKAAKTAKAPKAAKAPKVAKAPKAAKAPKVAKVAKSSGKGRIGTRYTAEQKKEVTDFVASYNAANGRGGQSKAAEKFSVSPLTVMAWLKASGGKAKVKKAATKGSKSVAPGKKTKVAKSAKPTNSPVASNFDVKLSSLLALSKEITRAEAALAQLNAKFKALKASL